MIVVKLYLGLGTNQGDRSKQLAEARSRCEKQLGRLVAASPIYESGAWGITDQADFLNQVILLHTECPPLECLEIVLGIEQEMGRKRLIKWGPRNIDIDLLIYNDLIHEDHRLSIPHPYLQDRRFVLQPLADIAPSLYHPVLEKSMVSLLEACPDKTSLRLFNNPVME